MASTSYQSDVSRSSQLSDTSDMEDGATHVHKGEKILKEGNNEPASPEPEPPEAPGAPPMPLLELLDAPSLMLDLSMVGPKRNRLEEWVSSPPPSTPPPDSRVSTPSPDSRMSTPDPWYIFQMVGPRRNRFEALFPPVDRYDACSTEMATHIDPEIYNAVTTGNNVALRSKLDDPELSILAQVSPQKNTILHISASLGHEHLIEPIIQSCPDLFKRKNTAGDLALHQAARNGYLSTIQSLLRPASCFELAGSSSQKPQYENVEDVLTEVNEEKNTALHLAMKNGHYEVARFLIEANPLASCLLNKEGKSPIFMAAEDGFLELVELMLEHLTKIGNPEQIMKDQPIVHAAIIGGHIDVLDALLSSSQMFVRFTDSEGRTPLSLATSLGHLDMVCSLLDKYREGIYMSNKNGLFPLHVAAIKGHVEIIQEFLQRYPDSKELLSKRRQNFLHMAAMGGKANVVSYVLKTGHLHSLINETDDSGNTPLHLAAMGSHAEVVHILTRDKRVELELVNKMGLTALDIAERCIRPLVPFRERLTFVILKSATGKAPRFDLLTNTTRNKDLRPQGESFAGARIGILLVVSTLIATVTFTASFTMPGGYNSSDPYKGIATLVEKWAFHAFLICDSIAMYSSTIVIALLIWAEAGDQSLMVLVLEMALPLLGIALATMSLAFMAAAFLAVSSLHWLGFVVLAMGSIFLAILFLIYIPLFLPMGSVNHPIASYFIYFPFKALLLLSTSLDTDEDLM